MDVGGQHVVLALDAFRKAVDQLRSFGSGLYLELRARSWTHTPSLSFCGKGYDPVKDALTLGFAIQSDAAGDRSVVFYILVAWDASHWSIQSFVEDEDVTRELITDVLWESQEYKATTLDELAESLQKSVHALVSSVLDQRV